MHYISINNQRALRERQTSPQKLMHIFYHLLKENALQINGGKNKYLDVIQVQFLFVMFE